MGKIQKNQSGFTMIEVLLVVLTLAVIGVAGYYVAKHVDNKNTAATTSTSTHKSTVPNTTVVSTSDGKVSISLPSDWEVASQFLYKKQPTIDSNSIQHCSGIDDTNSCIYETEFLPTSIVNGTYGIFSPTLDGSDSYADPSNPTDNDTWELSIEKESVQSVDTSSLPSGYVITQNTNSVNGYNASYAEYYYGPPVSNQSFISSYIINDGGYVATFSENCQPSGSLANPITTQSPYNKEFESIAQSIKFNL